MWITLALGREERRQGGPDRRSPTSDRRLGTARSPHDVAWPDMLGQHGCKRFVVLRRPNSLRVVRSAKNWDRAEQWVGKVIRHRFGGIGESDRQDITFCALQVSEFLLLPPAPT